MPESSAADRRLAILQASFRVNDVVFRNQIDRGWLRGNFSGEQSNSIASTHEKNYKPLTTLRCGRLACRLAADQYRALKTPLSVKRWQFRTARRTFFPPPRSVFPPPRSVEEMQPFLMRKIERTEPCLMCSFKASGIARIGRAAKHVFGGISNSKAVGHVTEPAALPCPPYMPHSLAACAGRRTSSEAPLMDLHRRPFPRVQRRPVRLRKV